MRHNYQDIEQEIRDGAPTADVEALLRSDSSAVTDYQIELLRADLVARDVARDAAALPLATRCESGEATGERCAWSGPAAEMGAVEWMPRHLRNSHRAAGNAGSYPANGALRLRCCGGCADLLCEDE